MTTDVSTVPVFYHRHLGVRIVLIRRAWRCSLCGHRVWVNGVQPISTKKMPVWTWPVELLDRYQARRQHVAYQ